MASINTKVVMRKSIPSHFDVINHRLNPKEEENRVLKNMNRREKRMLLRMMNKSNPESNYTKDEIELMLQTLRATNSFKII